MKIHVVGFDGGGCLFGLLALALSLKVFQECSQERCPSDFYTSNLVANAVEGLLEVNSGNYSYDYQTLTYDYQTLTYNYQTLT